MDKYIDYKKFSDIEATVKPIINDYVAKNLNTTILKDLSKFKKIAYSKITMIILGVLGIILIAVGAFIVTSDSLIPGAIVAIIGLILIGLDFMFYLNGARYAASITKRIQTKEAISTIFNSLESLNWITVNDKAIEHNIEEQNAIKWVHTTGWFQGWSYDRTIEFTKSYSGEIDSNPFTITSLKLRLYTLEREKDGYRKKYKNEQFVFFEVNTDVINESEINITHNAHPIKNNLKKIELESEEFNHNFKLLANDEVKVRMFLTPLAQESLVKLVGENALKHVFLYKCNGRLMIIVKCKYGSFGSLNKFKFIDKIQSNVVEALMIQTETVYLLSHLLLSFPMIQQEKYKSKNAAAGERFSDAVAQTRIPR